MENKFYYIYEIWGKKIGCAEDVSRRMMQQKIYDGRYEILEVHTDVVLASHREIILQKQYGYRVDSQLYYKVLESQLNINHKEAASKVDWTAAKAKVDWSKVLKEHRSHKINYDDVVKKRKETVKDYDWNKILTEKRTPKIDYKSIAAKKYKPINQYDLNNKLIKTWNSIAEAKEAMGTQEDRTINQCLSPNHPRQTAFNYIWKFVN